MPRLYSIAVSIFVVNLVEFDKLDANPNNKLDQVTSTAKAKAPEPD